MIDGTKLPMGESIFTHVLPDGENIHIHAGRLRQRLVSNPAFDHQRKLIPCDPRVAHRWIADNIVSPNRVVELLKRHERLEVLRRMEAVILCTDRDPDPETGLPDQFFVDGHHRYVMCSILRLPHVPAYLVPWDFWQPYRITGLPPMTRDQLLSLPITKRSY